MLQGLNQVLNFSYYITIAVLFTMLLGSNYKLNQQRMQLEAQTILMVTTARTLNDRLNSLKVSLEKSENKRRYILGLWQEAIIEGRVKVFD